jgi:hypothetical protein
MEYNQTPQTHSFIIEEPIVVKKRRTVLYLSFAAAIVALLVVLYLFPFANWAAEDYAGELSKQSLTTEDLLDQGIKDVLSNRTSGDAVSALQKAKDFYDEQKKNRPTLRSLPFVEYVNPKYELAVECKKAVKRYDSRINKTVDDALQSAIYHEVYVTTSGVAEEGVGEAVAAIEASAKNSERIRSFADAVRDETATLDGTITPSSLFDVHFNAISALENTDSSLRTLADEIESADPEVQATLNNGMKADLLILNESRQKIEDHVRSLKDKTETSRNISSEIEELEKQILE